MSENEVPQISEQKIIDNAHIKGDVSIGNITQTINQTNVDIKPDFRDLPIAQFTETAFGEFLSNSILIEQVSQNRFLVLSCDFKIDKVQYARCLACCLSRKLSSENEQIPVKEWVRKSDSQNVDIEIRATDKATVFVLNQITHQNIGYDLYGIQKSVSDRHYVIVSTDIPFENWNLPRIDKDKVWYQFPELDVKNIAENFGDLINKNNEETLRQWYLNLHVNEQLIALGLCFFDGLFENQFFDAIEQVAKKIKVRDQSLRAPDYDNLSNLYNFFRFVGVDNSENRRIEIKFPGDRFVLLEVVWKSHRRLVLNVLDTLVELVENSSELSIGELYSFNLQQEQLRKIIGETISNIGLISRESIEETLLRLAADRRMQVQAVAAQAMAIWRDKRQNDLKIKKNSEVMLFDTLQHWQDDKKIRSLVQSCLTGISEEKSKEPIDYIRATVALTVGYASQYDSPDHLSNSIYSLLEKLVDDSNQLVRERLRFHTLPSVISMHFNQLHDFIFKVAKKGDPNLILGVSEGLARAYQRDPKRILEILKGWRLLGKDSFSQPEQQETIQEPTEQQSLLCTVALAYGQIQYDTNSHSLNIQGAFHYIEKIFIDNEKSLFVRQNILHAILILGYRYFEEIEEKLRDFVAKLTIEERKVFVEFSNSRIEFFSITTKKDLFSILYEEQSANLKSDKLDAEKNNLNEQRSLTKIEKIILTWLKDEKHPVAQQMAVQGILIFEQFYRMENLTIQERIAQIKQQSTLLGSSEIIDLKSKNLSFYTNKLIPWLTTINRSDFRSTLRAIFPGISNHYRSHKELIELALNRWSDCPDKEIKQISDLLKKSLKLEKDLPWEIAYLISAILFASSVGAIVAGTQISTSPVSEHLRRAKTPTVAVSPSEQNSLPESSYSPAPSPLPESTPAESLEPRPFSDTLSSEEEAAHENLRDRRSKLGIKYNFFIPLVDEIFNAKHPELQGKVLDKSPEDKLRRQLWLDIANETLNDLETLSPELRRKLGTYKRVNYDKWLLELGETGKSSPVLDALANQRLEELFPDIKGKSLNTNTTGQIWYALAEEKLPEAQSQRLPENP